ncbi:hypothetical protein PoB_000699100 [Plakobranchus ocellatus]|uniref:Uncharacterized protein n=1 Tax=Plakobranchus ocellatus TaxID=259542 RepID=A0AAV3YDL9_9GAST|nr:hypothetical protein PoB_000699100 [Plakobranchus ocellatus]
MLAKFPPVAPELTSGIVAKLQLVAPQLTSGMVAKFPPVAQELTSGIVAKLQLVAPELTSGMVVKFLSVALELTSGMIRGFGSTVACESALRSAGTLLSRVRAPLPAAWPDGGPESLRSPYCGLAIYKNSKNSRI